MRIFGYHVPGTRDKAREIALLKEKVAEAKAGIRTQQEESPALEVEIRKLQKEAAALRSQQMDFLILVSKSHHN